MLRTQINRSVNFDCFVFGTWTFSQRTGMDFAHVFNGYRYHTKYDHIDYLPSNVLQRTGDNVLALVKRIANSDELTNTEVTEHEFLKNKFHNKILLNQIAGICQQSNGVF